MYQFDLCFIAGNLSYQAQSPDEAAMVSAARNFGFVFIVSGAHVFRMCVIWNRECKSHEILMFVQQPEQWKQSSIVKS